MRIHLAVLAVAALFVLLGPRPLGEQARAGIPLGDLVRPRPSVTTTTTARPEVPSERNPTISQLSPSLGGTGAATAPPAPGANGDTFLPPPQTGTSNLGTPSTTIPGTETPGVNPTSPGLPPTTPYAPSATTGVPPTAGMPQSTPPSTMMSPGSGR